MNNRYLPGLIAGSAVLALAGFVSFVNLSAKAPVGGAAAQAAGTPRPAQNSAPAGGRPGGVQGTTSGNGGAERAAGNPSSRAGGVAIVVDAAKAEIRGLESTAKLTGEVQAARSLKAYPETAGRLIEVLPAGTRVEEGAVVARVDPSRPGSRFEPSPVRAPLSGTIVSALLDPGANVTAASAIVEIATLSDLDVVVRVPERWASEVAVGTPADVALTAQPGRVYSARVRSADPGIDPVSRSKRVLLRLSGNVARVEPGMFAQVSLALSRSASSLVIPLEAVVRRGGSDIVYVVENGAARERAVRLGLFSETGAEVLEGLEPGDTVVVRGQNLIRDGSRVTVSAGSR